MALRLFASRYVRTTFYIAIDSGLRLARPLDSLSMLLPNNKAFVNWNDVSNSPDQKAWFEGSGKLLQGEGCLHPKYDTVVGVTPQILHR